MQDLEIITEKIEKNTSTFINEFEFDKVLNMKIFHELLYLNIFMILNQEIYSLDLESSKDENLKNLNFESDNLILINKFIEKENLNLTTLAKVYIFIVSENQKEQIIYLSYLKEKFPNQLITHRMLVNEIFINGLISKKTIELILNET